MSFKVSISRGELSVTGIDTRMPRGVKGKAIHREGPAGVSGKCKAGKHSECFKLNCTCDCGHGGGN